MLSIRIFGGEKLQGELKIQGSKNAVLPIIAATVLNKGTTILRNCPKILDVFHMIKVLEELGCTVSWEGNTLIIDTNELNVSAISEGSVRKMRSSVLFLGSLLGRCKEVKIAYPGGCSIGERPINYHLNAFKKLNITEEFLGEEQNVIYCHTDKIIGNDIFLEGPSVGATQNAILAAVLGEGVTRIFNAAREPEVTELCNFLQETGAIIYGKGTAFLEIEGVKKLHDVDYTLPSDRIVAGTYMTAIAVAGGEALFTDAPIHQLDSIIMTLKKVGCLIRTDNTDVCIKSDGRCSPIKLLKTQPYPGFPTDMQSQMLTLLCLANGTSIIQEDIFESRFQNVGELRKMGADIDIEPTGKRVVIRGVKELHGAVVKSFDLRGGAAMVIAGLAAKGETIVQDIINIERGYEDICRDLSILGAKVHYI